ncbi:sigma-70 family RNA polymerase sigma factor [Gemmata sp. JC673]|uniref:Sigma-70 family RNA polymerase sigma factor n=1 Tax=Gemmata algarum TaxID=2975278 RepID=A0ABU5F8G7_9BACT|nr:sigma-70 family RNA polymerase sigma factor [Gemmata algarum]MDY3563784.1 sigma-70 family RNA polymerase sigma factor [Gemmata algarum]
MAESADTGTLMKQLLTQALGGDQKALGQLLMTYRGYLRVLAQREIGGKLDARLDASDLIQQTCLSAVRNFKKFKGKGLPEFNLWLRQIHQRNVQDAVREHVLAAQRALNREQRLELGAEGRLAEPSEPSPSGRVMASEEAAVLASALEELPDDQREAVRLKHLEGLSLAEVADRMGRSEPSVAGLLKRGLQALREKLSAANQGAK